MEIVALSAPLTCLRTILQIFVNINSMSSTKHQQFLYSHCRVCGKTFGKKTSYTCSKYLTILEALGIDPDNDNDDIHPGCYSCYLTAK